MRSLPLQELDPNARCSHPGKAELLGGVTPEKVKLKSRPSVNRRMKLAESGPTNVSVEQDESSARFVVDKRAYRVFSILFHMTSANEQHSQGEVAWSDFLHAMASIGFSPEKLYG